MVNWITLPVLILKAILMGQTDKSNSGILRSNQSEAVNLWEHPASKSFQEMPNAISLRDHQCVRLKKITQCESSFIRKRHMNLFSVSWRIKGENLNLDIKDIHFSYFILGKCKTTKIQKIKIVILMNVNLK